MFFDLYIAHLHMDMHVGERGPWALSMRSQAQVAEALPTSRSGGAHERRGRLAPLKFPAKAKKCGSWPVPKISLNVGLSEALSDLAVCALHGFTDNTHSAYLILDI